MLDSLPEIIITLILGFLIGASVASKAVDLDEANRNMPKLSNDSTIVIQDWELRIAEDKCRAHGGIQTFYASLVQNHAKCDDGVVVTVDMSLDVQ